ncbi:MAG: tail fiber domain-containing protein [Verrucomicrobiales bacterium]|nr:tail fiber domain-containing protein [Verrucomicrobiales bacterium]
MKTKTLVTMIGLLVVVSSVTVAVAQGTAFTYQGRLDADGTPANGTYDLRFTIYDTGVGGSVVAGPLTNAATAVSNGLFTVTLDFGSGVFTGADRWLEIGVRSDGSGAFTTLAPRQQILPTPYAIRAANAGAAATATTATTALGVSPNAVGTAGLQDGSVTSAKIADGTIGPADLNVAGFNTTFWRAVGNTGTSPGTHFLGTTDNQPLEIKVNNQRALRLEPHTNQAPNVIGGAARNWVAAGVFGATISGGGAVDYLGAALTNRVLGNLGTVGGGGQNAANGMGATVSGGYQNTAGQNWATVAGGAQNTASGVSANVAGGQYNTANGDVATVGGGDRNTASGWHATSAGGWVHTASGESATVGGGNRNTADGMGATVAGGSQNTASQSYATVGGGWTNTANGSYATVGGGVRNRAVNSYATVAGGWANNANGQAASVGGGNQNSANGWYATVAGGTQNSAGGQSATVAGGYQNSASGDYGTVAGGIWNVATTYAFAAGRRANAGHSGAFVWADSTDADFASTAVNQFNVRAGGGVRFVTSGAGMTLDGQPVFVGYNGAPLTNLNASQLNSGVVPDARLSNNLARLNLSQTFTGTNNFSQRVGIGTTAPLRALHVRDVLGGTGGDIQVGADVGDSTPKLVHFGNVHTGAGRGYVAVGENGPDDRMELTAGTFVFTNLSQSGRVGIGRVPSANKLEVEGDASKTTAGSWLANSDARIKTDIQPVTDALAKLDQVRLVSFRYRDDYRTAHPSVADRRYLNVVAQEFREVFPEHVQSSGEKLPDGSEILQVDIHPLTIYTAAAVQELHRELRRRDAENAALKARLERLETLLETQLSGGAR